MLARVLAGDYELDRRMTLDARVAPRPRTLRRFRALNDVVITNGALARIVEFVGLGRRRCRSRPTAPTG